MGQNMKNLFGWNIDCTVQRNMVQSANLPPCLQRNIDWGGNKEEFLLQTRNLKLKGQSGRNVFNLFSKQTFSQRCDEASWENSLIFMENPELIFPTSTSTGILPHLSPLSTKSAKGFLEIRCISYPQVVVILYHIKGFFSFCRGSVLVLYNLSQL